MKNPRFLNLLTLLLQVLLLLTGICAGQSETDSGIDDLNPDSHQQASPLESAVTVINDRDSAVLPTYEESRRDIVLIQLAPPPYSAASSSSRSSRSSAISSISRGNFYQGGPSSTVIEMEEYYAMGGGLYAAETTAVTVPNRSADALARTFCCVRAIMTTFAVTGVAFLLIVIVLVAKNAHSMPPADPGYQH